MLLRIDFEKKERKLLYVKKVLNTTHRTIHDLRKVSKRL